MKKADLDRALCSRPDTDETLFFPDFEDSPEETESKVSQAKAICDECPVRMQCLQTALDRNEDYGVWGGRCELTLRRSRFVDVSGRPVKDRPSVICPNCLDETHKDLYVIEVFAKNTDVGCHNCGLMWSARKVLDRADPEW